MLRRNVFIQKNVRRTVAVVTSSVSVTSSTSSTSTPLHRRSHQLHESATSSSKLSQMMMTSTNKSQLRHLHQTPSQEESSTPTNSPFFKFKHHPKSKSFFVDFSVIKSEDNNNLAESFSIQVPYIFLSDHSITFCDPDTLQRSLPVDYNRDQDNRSSPISFDESKTFLDATLRLVFFCKTGGAAAAAVGDALKADQGQQPEQTTEWLVVPVESFFQLAAAREGQIRRDPAVSVDIFESLMNSYKVHHEQQQQNENVEKFNLNVIPASVKQCIEARNLDAVRTAAGLTSCHLRLAVANWLQHHQQVKTVVKEFNNNENNESEQIDFGNVSISALPEVTKLWRKGDVVKYFSGKEGRCCTSQNNNNGNNNTNNNNSHNKSATHSISPKISGIFPPELQEFIRNQEGTNNFNDNKKAELIQQEVEKILTSSSSLDYRAKKVAHVAHAIEKFGFVVIDDPIIELGLPSPLALSTAEEPTGIPTSGMIADLLKNRDDHRRALKVVQRRNAVDFTLKFLFGVLMNSFYGITPVWGNFKAKQKIDHLDTAYLTVGIDLHTDQTYSLHAPKLQGFGLIHEEEKISAGGKNVLADGFAVAKFMSERYPREFAALTSNTVPAYYAKDGRFLSGYRPVFKTTKMYGNDSLGSISQVSFNAYDRAPAVVFDIPSSSAPTNSSAMDKMNQFYRAYTLFGDLCHDRLNEHCNSGSCGTNNNNNKIKNDTNNNEKDDNVPICGKNSSPSTEACFSFEVQPKIGSMLIFDNHRCLHARTAFAGPRIMSGSYISLDDYFSALNQFQFQ